jgi:O-methyltransferase
MSEAKTVSAVPSHLPTLSDIKDPEFWALFNRSSPYSLLTPEKLYNLYSAVRYITQNHILGDVIECGVWKGGAVLLIADALFQNGDANRKLFLYDTFEGFVERSDIDRTDSGKEVGRVRHANFEAEARRTLSMSQYPTDNVHFVAGDVRKTVMSVNHATIALLRLDTDTYATTAHELSELYDRLVVGGVLIVDDYGYSQGCRQAVDEFCAGRRCPLFQRPNSGCRTAVKISL